VHAPTRIEVKPEDASQWRRLPKIWLLLIIPFAVYACWRFKVASDVPSQIASLKKNGYHTSALDLNRLYPSIPDPQNIGLEYLRVTEKITEPYTNAEKEFVTWAEQKTAGETSPVRLVAWHKSNCHLLDHLQKINGSNARYPVDLTQGCDAKFPHLNQIRKASLLASIDAVQKLTAADPEGAATSIALMLRLGNSLSGEPIFMPLGFCGLYTGTPAFV